MAFTFNPKLFPKKVRLLKQLWPSDYSTNMARTANTADLPQALSAKQATLIENYLIERDFELRRRQGSRTVASVASSPAAYILRQWTDTLMILGYGTTLAAFNTNDNTLHTIKSNFSTNVQDGVRYGNNFYSCNGKYGDIIYQTQLPTLPFTTLTQAFTLGDKVTGGTSKATATIIQTTVAVPYDTLTQNFTVGGRLLGGSSGAQGTIYSVTISTGTTGTLQVINVVGTFTDDETITGSIGGSALVNGSPAATGEIILDNINGTFVTSETITDPSGGSATTSGGTVWTNTAPINGQVSLAIGSISGSYVPGDLLTGGSSGATAVIVSTINKIGSTANLILTTVTGTFTKGETVTGASSGSATATSVAITIVPKCEVLYILGLRLAAGNTNNSASEVHLSAENDFTAWDTSSAVAGLSYAVSFARFGNVNSIGILNIGQATFSEYKDLMIAFYDSGILGWRVALQTVGTQNLQTTLFEIQDPNHSGKRGALSVQDVGIFYGNDSGEYLLQPKGNSVNISWNFGRNVVAQLNPDQADRIYMPEKYLVFITTNKNAATNNIWYWFDTRTVGTENALWGTITGIPTNRFCLMGSQLYGASANSGKIREIFPANVWDDDGTNVFYHYVQPININGLESINDLIQQRFEGFLSPNNPITITFYGYNENGVIVNTGVTYQWESTGAPGALVGLGEMQFGVDQFGDTPQPGGTVWTPATGWEKAYGYNSYILDVSGNDQAPHTISHIGVQVRSVRQQRRNVLIPTNPTT